MAAGAVALGLTGVVDVVATSRDHAMQMNIDGTWTMPFASQIFNHNDYKQGGTASVPTNVMILDKIVDYENTTGSNQEVTQARIVSSIDVSAVSSDILFPAANIQGSPVTLEPGQILRFTSIECTIV